MLKRSLWGVLVSLIVLLSSGAALSSNHQHVVLQVMDFEADTGILIGYPDGDKTQHRVGLPPHLFPPNPCKPIANVWYHLARQNNAEVRHAQTFRVMVALMATFRCNADLEFDPTQNPPALIAISPRP
jgi:hypothetical protein